MGAVYDFDKEKMIIGVIYHDEEVFRRRPLRLILDLSHVEFMDSSGLGLIMGRAEYASKHDCVVLLDGLSPALRKLVSLCGLDRVKNLSLVTKERNYPR